MVSIKYTVIEKYGTRAYTKFSTSTCTSTPDHAFSAAAPWRLATHAAIHAIQSCIQRSRRSLFGIPPTAELAEIRLFYYSRKIETRQKHKFWYPEKRLYRGVPLGSSVWKRILLRKCLVWGFQLPLPNGTPLYLQKCLQPYLFLAGSRVTRLRHHTPY